MEKEMRLIDANVLSCEIDCFSFETSYEYEKVLEIIAEAPTVDAVEVVRCKDCKWRQQDEVNRNFCGLGDFYCGDTDFCSRGERKDNG